MKIGWLAVVLVISLLANVGLAIGWGLQIFSEAVLYTDTGSTFRHVSRERAQMRAMRSHFCPGNPAPDRAALLAWEESVRPDDRLSEPYDEEGLLWLADLGVKLDERERLVGLCPYMTWQHLERPSGADLDRAGAACPLEPLC